MTVRARVVASAEPASLGEWLPPHDRAAIGEGRVFVNGARASMDTELRAGDRVEVHAARADTLERARVLARYGAIVFAEKPASLPTTPERRGLRSLESDLEEELGVSVRAASRLDVGVSGVVLCTLDHDAAKAVVLAREAGDLRRVYVAIASAVVEGEGEWSAPIGRVKRGGRPVPCAFGSSQEPARTRFRAVAMTSRATLLRLEPVTGRMHQLRVHAAHAGAPLFGDRLHGGPAQLVDAKGKVHPLRRIALHALRVELPIRGARRSCVATVPDELVTLWNTLDGERDAWNRLEAS